ncbi:hypothetical protein [Rhodopirellula sp. MGV]|uniref:hypothetical protein n=1 Tax=Rhodopirellula sp. MGV TaxID=2023130 RepID=UPI000B95F2D6|nr:hypothetical protein [Rhodopirellula sp. MGV]OYP31602.1 hypothetical protein CGZ80_21170 [Rhodopirellula sp. MGV]PNY36329.1 hypothetical protein C2E31_13650 [Rhodopirellula baltica]PNY37711.1 hypothetical protein C2E31_06120 [Rhodopirellula baltica]
MKVLCFWPHGNQKEVPGEIDLRPILVAGAREPTALPQATVSVTFGQKTRDITGTRAWASFADPNDNECVADAREPTALPQATVRMTFGQKIWDIAGITFG